ncbi:hypothetical protein J1792_24610 [Streptomyces triculaminicus]|uniref:Uncharacterized protein n=1 Tax=Streptomyces triculaminicus TaxID=2816232 RepID=A0A939JSG9_9ACTN|nr:hypothetical protein [Streptomyces triculaminicus]MBO0655842.1 hypothetical protein [Streptomyces triculaminicus]
MPTNFLPEEQRKRFGHFAEEPGEGQLAGSFLLDQTARRHAMTAKGARNRLGSCATKTSPRLSPLMFAHINFHGPYSFALPAEVQGGQLRATRKPADTAVRIAGASPSRLSQITWCQNFWQ